MEQSGRGANGGGLLGQGTNFPNRVTPVQVMNLSNVVRIAGTSYHACAVTSAGALYCWGINYNEQLGPGSTEAEEPVPRLVQGLANVVDVAAGGSSTCAVLRDGLVSCWGANDTGQLGRGTTDGTLHAPANVAGLANVKQITAARKHVCALTQGEKCTAGAVTPKENWGGLPARRLGCTRARTRSWQRTRSGRWPLAYLCSQGRRHGDVLGRWWPRTAGGLRAGGFVHTSVG